MNRFEKALDRIVKNVEPQDNRTEEDLEHFRAVKDALEICAENLGEEG